MTDRAARILEEALQLKAGDPRLGPLVGAAVSIIVDVNLVLVGGAAVNLHTGSYLATDIDLVGAATPAELDRLLGFGFVRSGSYYSFGDGPRRILVQVPSSKLSGVDDPLQIEVADGITASVISLEDLLMDRLVQATDGTGATLDEAIRLSTGAYGSVEWDVIHKRVAERSGGTDLVSDRIEGVLNNTQRGAKRALRKARGAQD